MRTPSLATEAQIQKTILKALNDLHYEAFRFSVTGNLHTDKLGRVFVLKNPLAGFPDIFGFYKRRSGAFTMEVKQPKGRLTTKQQWWIGKLNQNGIDATVVRSVLDAVTFLQIHDQAVRSGM